MSGQYRVTSTNHPFREEKTFSCGRTSMPQPVNSRSDLDRVVELARSKAKGTNDFDIDQWDKGSDQWVRLVTRGKRVKK